MSNPSLEAFEVKSFEQRLKETKLNTGYEELNYTKSRRKYELLKEEIQKCDYETNFKSTTLTEVDVKLFLYDYLSKLFPCQRQQIKDILPFIKENSAFASVEHDCVLSLNSNNILNNIFVPSYQDPVVIPSCGKQIIGALLASQEEKTFGNIHYIHLPGIIFEKILSKGAEETFPNSFYHPMESIRLNHLKTILNNLDEITAYPEEIKKHEWMIPIINYQEHETFSYVIGDIYATALFKKYLEDEETFLQIFRKFMNGDCHLNTLLEFYDISLKNFDTVSNYQKKIEKHKKTNENC